MKSELNALVESLRAVGEPSRLRILALLRQNDLSVGELVDILGQSQPGISQHLKTLTACGLVERLPEGSFVFYRAVGGDAGRGGMLDAILGEVDLAAGDFARDASRLDAVRRARAESADTYFERVAGDWDAIRALHYPNDAIEAALLDAAGPGPFERVVDIGTGTGRMLALFSPFAETLEGIDRSHEMLTVARANLARDGITNAKVRQGDATALPFEDNGADLVIIHQVLHYIDDPSAVIAEAGRVLRKEGRLLIVDFAPHALEFLRIEHAHRHLGLCSNAVSEWAAESGLSFVARTEFAPPSSSDEGLAVQIISAETAGAQTEAAA
ncbi:MAG: metalloregulator ArsR/SmtB family transcription factor [Pseudomonadota bacterium]